MNFFLRMEADVQADNSYSFMGSSSDDDIPLASFAKKRRSKKVSARDPQAVIWTGDDESFSILFFFVNHSTI